jgi:putative membrane protein
MEIIDSAAIEPYRGLINYWGLQTVAMMVTALLIPRMRITSLFGALGIVLALGLVNATVWDTALFFSVPSSFSQQALTLLASNGLLFWILVKLLPGIEIEGFGPALVAPVVFTALSLAISTYGRDLDLMDAGRRAATLVSDIRDRLQTQPDAVDPGKP